MRPLVRAFNGLGVALVALREIMEIRHKRVEALITIVQGRYYLAAALAAWATATPHITIVHDSFISANSTPSNLLRRALRYLTQKTLRSAAHVYAVSPEMQSLVLRECGAGSEIQLPSSTLSPHAEGQAQNSRECSPVILFAGTTGYTVRDCLDLLADMIATGQLKAKLHLCTAMTETEMQKFGRNCDNIVCRGWVSQSELQEAFSSADILFLPYSFLESSREAVETAFPSKIADYLAAGKPILVFGPRYSSLVRYTSEQGFAEVVDEFSAAALARGIQKIVFSPLYKEKLAARALEVFSANHDIRCQQEKFYLTLERIVRRSPRKAVPSKLNARRCPKRAFLTIPSRCSGWVVGNHSAIRSGRVLPRRRTKLRPVSTILEFGLTGEQLKRYFLAHLLAREYSRLVRAQRTTCGRSPILPLLERRSALSPTWDRNT
jgi:glycosyltransferase involved in cell wall biosynthesis